MTTIVSRIIGLTGSVGCGKSAVGTTLEDLGLKRLDTDQIARSVVGKGTPGLAAVIEAFGSGVLNPDETLNRSAVGEIVFNNEAKRKLLESTLHPLIWSQVEAFVSHCRKNGEHAVIEVPLLYENERQELFDKIWVVASSPELQRARLRGRNGWTEQEIEARITSQMPLQQKIDRADTVIWNNGTVAELEDKVREAWRRESP
jgi:dephospho-CoA kinase